MSFEEYKKSPVYKATNILGRILNKKNIDWDLFDQELSKLPDINVIYEEDTILSELYHECPDGTVLVEITKRFLAAGYDVAANDGQNGAMCLHNLCWATYDKYILDAAKLLLAAGADTKLSVNDDAEELSGVKGSISWRLSGDWVEGAYTVANTFEAYWQLVEAHEEGKDYQSICTFEDCIGQPLLGAEIISSKSVICKPPLTAFDGHLVLWFGDKPLVISKYIDFVVNPVYAMDNKPKTAPADQYLQPLLYAKLSRFVFVDQCTAQLQFDNGMYLLLSSSDYRNKEIRYGFFEICKDTQIDLNGEEIDSIVLTPGKTYSDSCDRFSEHSVSLICGDKAFLLHRYPEGYSKSFEIHIIKCSLPFVADYKRKIVLSDLKFEKAFLHQHKLSGMRIACGTKYFYLFADQYDELHLKLTEEKITSWQTLTSNRTSEKLMFQVEPPSKTGWLL